MLVRLRLNLESGNPVLSLEACLAPDSHAFLLTILCHRLGVRADQRRLSNFGAVHK